MFKKQKGMAFISTSPLKSQNKVSKNTNATKQLIKIEPGEYQLHFFIEETRGLENADVMNDTTEPLIKVSVFGETKTVGPKNKVGSGQIYWGDHMFFTKKIDESRFFFSQKLKIEILNYHKIGKNSIIGEISLDLISIFKEQKHALLHQWAGISNFGKNYEEILGFLKFSVTITGEKDDPIVLEKERTLSQKDRRKNTDHIGGGGSSGAEVLMPPHLRTKGFQMKISLVKGEQFMKLDLIGTIDSYIIAEFGNARYETEPIKDNQNPIYGLIIYLPFSEPTINEYLRITVMDKDFGKKDDILGTLMLKKCDILSKKYKNITWFDIYGSQSDNTNLFGDLMNSDSKIGSFWKGRIQLAIECFEMEKPLYHCEKIEENTLSLMNKNNISTEFFILAEAFYAFSLPKENANYSIQIRWANQELNFPEKKGIKSFCEWYLRKQTSPLSLPYSLPQDFSQLPDLILYLLLDNKRVSFLRIPIKDFLSPSQKPQLYHLKPERSQALDIRQDLAGIVKIRIGVLLDKNLIEGTFKEWGKEFMKPEIKTGILISNIYHCKDLIPSDNEGTSDPFITISYHGIENSTNVIDQTLNPVWNERLNLKIPIIIKESGPDYEEARILIKIFDKDSIKLLDTQVYSKDEFLGAGVIEVLEAKKAGFLVFNNKTIPNPQWVNLKYNSINVGKILISFNILEYEAKMPMEILPFNPPSERYTIKIRILGLRNLKSSGLLSVQKAVLKFDVGSLNPIGLLKENQDYLIVSSPESGPDPNICTILKFEADLPKNYSLCPSLTCLVLDTVWEGILQPVLGSFAIDLGNIMANNKELMKKLCPKQNEFIMNHPLMHLGETNDPFIMEIEGEEMNLITEKYKKDKDKVLREENSIIADDYLKSIQKYPEVLNEKGELKPEYMVIKPKYTRTPKKQFMTEDTIPDPEHYIGLGHDKREDKLKNQTNKHYRYYINTELEKSGFMNQNLFSQFPIFKGKRFVEEDFLDFFSMDQRLEEVGLFKGWVEVYQEKLGEDKLKTMKTEEVRKGEEIDALILKEEEFLVRVYVIDVLNLQQMDDDSLSDPYVRIVLGSRTIDNREEYRVDQINVGIFKIFEIKCSLPGPSQLRVQVWDYDLVKSDDLIGETIIDLENRHFSTKWRSLVEKPIETRILYQPTSSLPRGKIRLWLNLIPVENIEKTFKWFIEPKPKQEFEIRVVVWNCKNVPLRDKEGTSDIYVVGRFGNQSQETDTHIRSTDGYGSFNWRMVWRVKLPNKDNTISFQIWDKDFMTDDDFIAEATVDFNKQAEIAYENDAIAKIYGNKLIDISNSVENLVEKLLNPKGHVTAKTKEIFKITLKIKSKEGVSDPPINKKESPPKKLVHKLKKKKKNREKLETCTLNLSFEIVPLEFALKNPVGNARKDPNSNPWLPPPLKRYNFGIDPKTFIANLIDPDMKAKILIGGILGICGCICCLFLIIFLAALAANSAI